MNRRHLMRTTALVPVVVALASCNGLTAAQVTAQVVSDVSLIAQGLNGALSGLGTAGVSASVVATVGQYVGKIQSLAAGVSTALSQTAAQPVVQQIGAALIQIAQMAGPLLPPPWGTAVAAAEVLLPVVEAAIGMITSTAPAAPAMTPDAARLILGGHAAMAK